MSWKNQNKQTKNPSPLCLYWSSLPLLYDLVRKAIKRKGQCFLNACQDKHSSDVVLLEQSVVRRLSLLTGTCFFQVSHERRLIYWHGSISTVGKNGPEDHSAVCWDHKRNKTCPLGRRVASWKWARVENCHEAWVSCMYRRTIEYRCSQFMYISSVIGVRSHWIHLQLTLWLQPMPCLSKLSSYACSHCF